MNQKQPGLDATNQFLRAKFLKNFPDLLTGPSSANY